MNYFEVLIPQLLGSIPYLVAWVVALTLAVVMLKRKGSRAERFLVIGCAMMLGSSLLKSFIYTWLKVSREASNISIAATMGKISCLSLAGVVCVSRLSERDQKIAN